MINLNYYNEDEPEDGEIDFDEIDAKYRERQEENRARDTKLMELERQRGILNLKIQDLEDKIEEIKNPEGHRAVIFNMPGTYLFTRRGGVTYMTKL